MNLEEDGERMSVHKRSMPNALYHVTTERNWQQIVASGAFNDGKGYGWEERSGVFALGWDNWVSTRTFHYLHFLTIKLQGKRDKIVVLRIQMTPEIAAGTEVAFLASSETDVGKVLLDKARSGRFSNIKHADDVVLMEHSRLIRNTFLLKEFVREAPPSLEPVEYIIRGGVRLDLVRKVAEITTAEIPPNFLKAGKRLGRFMKKYPHGRPHKRTSRPVKPLITKADRESVFDCLLASRRRLQQGS